jgi:hypothetical protein
LGLGIYDPKFLVAHDDRGQRGKVCNACVTFVNLMVVNDYGSSDEISSVDLSLLTTLLSWNLNRIVPPRAGLIRPVRSSPCSGFLVNLSKEGISVKRSLPGHSRKQIKGDNFPRMAGHD